MEFTSSTHIRGTELSKVSRIFAFSISFKIDDTSTLMKDVAF